MPTADPRASQTLDPAEIDRFAHLAAEWWDTGGKFRTLHRIGPARLTFLRDALLRHFGRAPGMGSDPAGLPPGHASQAQAGGESGRARGEENVSSAGDLPPPRSAKPLAGLTILDIGCGGGLVCEPLARLGAAVTGIDPAEENIAAARRHAETQGLAVTYRAARVEDLAAEGRTFDAVSCLEVVEHVPDPAAFLATCAGLVRPGGLMLLSTINRTVKAYLLAIIGAEYVLRWLPVGTHQWERFVTPDELARHLAAAGLEAPRFQGLVYDPLADSWSLSADTDVNYFAAAGKALTRRQ